MHKRKHGRVRARGVASHLRDGAQLLTGLSVENLSMGGAFIRTPHPLEHGAAVVLDLVKPGLKRSIRLTGRVASAVLPGHAKEAQLVPGMGVQFDPLPPETSERLHELLVSLGAERAVLEADPPEQREAQEPSPAPGEGFAVPEGARLMVQVRGLLMELGEWQAKVAALEQQNTVLQAEVDRLTAWIEATGGKVPPRRRD